MQPSNISPYSVKTSGIKSLLSNHYMLAFFKKFYNAIVSRMWKFKKAKNARYEDQDFYYGQREDAMIKGTNRQKGTKKMRHYLGFSILSKNVHLFAGLE